jgi:hypothetical protein
VGESPQLKHILKRCEAPPEALQRFKEIHDLGDSPTHQYFREALA